MFYSHLLAGNINTEGNKKEYFSPIDNSVMGNIPLLGKSKLVPFFSKLDKKEKISSEEIIKSFKNLAYDIKLNKKIMRNQIVKETGYTLSDSEDIIESATTLLENYKKHLQYVLDSNPPHPYDFTNNQRQLFFHKKPYGVVAALTSQNAPLILEITILVNALYAGNCVIIKPSTQTAGVTSLLGQSISRSFSKKLLSRVSLLTCKAPDFLVHAYKYADIIHFIGSSKYFLSLFTNGIVHSKEVIFDGEGGSIILVDRSANLDKAVEICKNSLIRCNGELCTSLKGVIIEKSVKKEFLKKLRNLLINVKIGNPFDQSVDMGPLFSTVQIEEIKKSVRNETGIVSNYNYIKPIVLEAKKIKNINKLIYGPVAWIETYEGNNWKNILKKISYTLSDVYIGEDKRLEREFMNYSRAPRIVINADPTEESPFEPWGGNLPYGYNHIGYWLLKYQKISQIDKMNI